jgi:hypothetical protein
MTSQNKLNLIITAAHHRLRVSTTPENWNNNHVAVFAEIVKHIGNIKVIVISPTTTPKGMDYEYQKRP